LGHSLAVVAVVFLVIEKTGSHVFFPSLTPLMRHFIVKMTWFCPECLVHRGSDFYLVPREFGGKISHFWQEIAVLRKNIIS
jgi:hypothetical protein